MLIKCTDDIVCFISHAFTNSFKEQASYCVVCQLYKLRCTGHVMVIVDKFYHGGCQEKLEAGPGTDDPKYKDALERNSKLILKYVKDRSHIAVP